MALLTQVTFLSHERTGHSSRPAKRDVVQTDLGSNASGPPTFTSIEWALPFIMGLLQLRDDRPLPDTEPPSKVGVASLDLGCLASTLLPGSFLPLLPNREAGAN